MSRSRKKNPIAGITGHSEKYDKQKWHKRLRQKTKQVLTAHHYDVESMEAVVLPDVHDVSDPWTMEKDHKVYFGDVVNDPDEKVKPGFFDRIKRLILK